MDALVQGEAPQSDLTDQWARRWTLAGGIVLVVTFLLPSGVSRLDWPWTVLEGAKPDVAFLYLTPLALGIAALVAGAWARPPALGVVLTALAGTTVYLQFGGMPWRSTFYWSPGLPNPVPEIALLPILLGGAVLVAGNHLRKLRPNRVLPRVLPRVGAGLILAGLLIPVIGGEPIAAMLISAYGWRESWPLEIVLLAVLALGVVGMIPPSRANPSSLPALVSFLARGVAVLTALALFATDAREDAFHLAALHVVKWDARDLAMLVLLAVGLVAWLDVGLRAGVPEEAARKRPVVG